MSGPRCPTTRKKMGVADQLNFATREFSQTMLPTNIDVYSHFLEVKRKMLSLDWNITRPIRSAAKTVTKNISEVCERAGLVQWNLCGDKTNEEPVLMKTNHFSESNIATKVEKLHATVQQKRKHLCKGRAVLFSGAGALLGGGNTYFWQESRTQRSP